MLLRTRNVAYTLLPIQGPCRLGGVRSWMNTTVPPAARSVPASARGPTVRLATSASPANNQSGFPTPRMISGTDCASNGGYLCHEDAAHESRGPRPPRQRVSRSTCQTDHDLTTAASVAGRDTMPVRRFVQSWMSWAGMRSFVLCMLSSLDGRLGR